MKIGSFDTSSITSKISDAVDTVKAKVVAAEEKVETFARSEYEEVKDFAKVTGEKIEAKVEAVKQDLPSFRVPQGVSDLGKKVFGDSKKATVEGGADLGVKNSKNPDEKVDLGDKEKFLATWGQKDSNTDTLSDGARCQSNTIIAGLLAKGGPDEVKKGLSNARDLANEQLKTEADPNRKKALELAVKNLGAAIDGIGAKSITRGQMDHAADALFTVMTPAKNGDRQQFDAEGLPAEGNKGVNESDIRNMEKCVGLTQGQEGTTVKEAWLAPLTDDNREVSDKVWKSIEPGKSAHVAVNLYGEHIATGKDPYGNDMKKDRNGEPYFDERIPNPNWNPADNASEQFKVKRHYVNEEAQHAVLMGKNADGTRYIYNPMGDPPYMTEKPGDKASSEALDKMAASLMGVQKGKGRDSNDWQAEVTPYAN